MSNICSYFRRGKSSEKSGNDEEKIEAEIKQFFASGRGKRERAGKTDQKGADRAEKEGTAFR